MDLNLKGKRALVTGGSKGIGKSCAQVLAEEGCEVMIVSRDGDALAAAAADINTKTGSDVKWKAADLSQRGVAEELAQWAAQSGALDILVNNAGAIPGGDLLKVDEDTWRRAWGLWPTLSPCGGWPWSLLAARPCSASNSSRQRGETDSSATAVRTNAIASRSEGKNAMAAT